MWNEVLIPIFNISLSDFENAWEPIKDENFDVLTTKQKWELIEKTKKQWLQTFDVLDCALRRHDQFPQHAMAHSISRFDDLRRNLIAHADVTDMSSAINTIFDFFVKFTILVSDITYVLEHNFKPDLQELEGVRDRADVLSRILGNVPRDVDLGPYVQDTLASLPAENTDCPICLDVLGNDVNTGALENLLFDSVDDPTQTTWITLNEEARASRVKDDFKGVPIKMACGHVFCAGCINGWLEGAPRVKCPLRDEDYGVYRSKVVKEMEFLKEIHEYGREG